MNAGGVVTHESGGRAGHSAPLLEMRGVSRRFGAVQALHDVSLELRAGRVHALIGENGAGKSTLVKILTGSVRPDSGEVVLDGETLSLSSPLAARQAGIASMQQEPAAFPDLTVAENVFTGRMPRRRGLVDHGAARRRTAEVLADLDVDLEPDAPVRGLSVADRQIMEMAKALTSSLRVLVMDEPTAALSPREVDRLFAIVRRLLARDVAVLFVTHRLDEIVELGQDATVLRNGRCVASRPVEGLPRSEMISLMAGRELSAEYPPRSGEIGEPVLEVERLRRAGVFDDVSLEVRAGEIVGLGGLVGAGRSEVARCLFGIDRPTAGTVRVGGRVVPGGSPADAIKAGVAYVPEDRLSQGLVPRMSVADNITLGILGRIATPVSGLIRRRLERDLAQRYVERFEIRTPSVGTAVEVLSGGTQQKVLLSKWLATEPRLLILDEPTRGVDVQTKAEIHRLVRGLADRGLAILLISSEMAELMGMADRLVVLCEGRVTGRFVTAEANEEDVLTAATDRGGEVAS